MKYYLIIIGIITICGCGEGDNLFSAPRWESLPQKVCVLNNQEFPQLSNALEIMNSTSLGILFDIDNNCDTSSIKIKVITISDPSLPLSEGGETKFTSNMQNKIISAQITVRNFEGDSTISHELWHSLGFHNSDHSNNTTCLSYENIEPDYNIKLENMCPEVIQQIQDRYPERL